MAEILGLGCTHYPGCCSRTNGCPAVSAIC